jgi:FecR protein
MKKLSILLALMALFFTDLALAAGAVATSIIGTVQAQTGPSASRPVRQGDELSQGDTVVTGANSSAVLKFDDGQVVALTSNSRMTITAYQYNPATESGNVLLSLVTGGMRAITGLIGRRSPNQVAYRAATATIGIRGTDGTIATNGTDVVVTVTEGVMTLTQGDLVLTITAGEAVFTRPGQQPIRGTIASVIAQLPPAFAAAVAQSGALSGAVNAAGPGTQRQGGDQGSSGQTGQQGGAQGGGAGGGTGNASGS